MAEAVKVMVRCRPMNARENGLGCKDVICIDERLAQCSIKNPHDDKAPPKDFSFDCAYGAKSTTQQIYAEIGFPLVEGVTEGYNGTIFAYGQTGSGKSFTMQGITDPATQKGIIPRAFDHMFEKIQVTEGAKYLIHASYLEIYNEEIRDLLGKDIKQKLELKEHPDKGVYVQSLSMHLCKNVRTCEQVMEHGWTNRSTGATLMNADSSRSHSIFTIHMERAETDGKGEEHIRVAKLNLVDLAGSERQGKTGTTGDRLKEATKINLSLSALGNVISSLVDGKSTQIPYRDSKLTRLLQDSLGGNTKTLMVACVSPADNSYEDTLSTLRYANRAKNIKNKPKINEDPKDALLREYQDEIKRLKVMLTGQLPLQLPPIDDDRSDRTELPTNVDRERDMDDLSVQSDKMISNDERQMPASKTSNLMTRLPDDDVIERLAELEQTMVGGEEINNEEVKERHQKKKKFAEERSNQLRDALALMDGEEIMIDIYQNDQDKLRVMEKKLKKETERAESLKCEIGDLQSEFESDRRDYLDTIRKQEMNIKWLEGVINRIHPTLGSGCNFDDLDQVRTQSKWDENNANWTLPMLTVIKVQLPIKPPRKTARSKKMTAQKKAAKNAARNKRKRLASSHSNIPAEKRVKQNPESSSQSSSSLTTVLSDNTEEIDVCNPSIYVDTVDSEDCIASTSKARSFSYADTSQKYGYSREVFDSYVTLIKTYGLMRPDIYLQSKNSSVACAQMWESYLPDLSGIDHVLFVDMDNWSKYLQNLLQCFPDTALFWCFLGGTNSWTEPLDSPIYVYSKKIGHIYINKKCGESKDAADFAICLTVGRVDAVLPKSVPFTILSGDTGFQEIQEQFTIDKRHLSVISPHNQTVSELCTAIMRFQSTD